MLRLLTALSRPLTTPLKSAPSPQPLFRPFCTSFTTSSQDPSNPSQPSNSSNTSSESDLSSLKSKLLSASLLHLKTEGFTHGALTKACSDLSLSSASSRLIDGPVEIVFHLNKRWEEGLEVYLDAAIEGEASRAGQPISYRQKVKLGIMYRLKNIQPYIEHWDEALSWVCHPLNLPTAHETMMDFSGKVLQAAGDKSARMDWYYSRYKLTGVILASELFMLTDRSDGFFETEGFVDRALDAIEQGEAIYSDIHETLYGLWVAKNAFTEMAKDPVIDRETQEVRDKVIGQEAEPKQDK